MSCMLHLWLNPHYRLWNFPPIPFIQHRKHATGWALSCLVEPDLWRCWRWDHEVELKSIKCSFKRHIFMVSFSWEQQLHGKDRKDTRFVLPCLHCFQQVSKDVEQLGCPVLVITNGLLWYPDYILRNFTNHGCRSEANPGDLHRSRIHTPWLLHDSMTTMNWTCPVAVGRQIRQMSGDVQRPGSDQSAKLHNGCGRLEDLLWFFLKVCLTLPVLLY